MRTVMAGPSDFAVVGGWPPDGEMPLAELVARFLADGDVVLAEGFKRSPEPKVEVFRGGRAAGPLVTELPDLAEKTLALVTDQEGVAFDGPIFDLGDEDHVTRLADFLEQALGLDGS